MIMIMLQATFLCVRVSEAGAGAGEVREIRGGRAGLAAGEAGAHVTREHQVMRSHVSRGVTWGSEGGSGDS